MEASTKKVRKSENVEYKGAPTLECWAGLQNQCTERSQWVRIPPPLPIYEDINMGLAKRDTKFSLYQCEIAMKEGLMLLDEIEFRLSQSPYLSYKQAKKEAQEYARAYAKHMIRC